MKCFSKETYFTCSFPLLLKRESSAYSADYIFKCYSILKSEIKMFSSLKNAKSDNSFLVYFSFLQPQSHETRMVGVINSLLFIGYLKTSSFLWYLNILFSMEMIKVSQAEDCDTAWAVPEHVISKETEILLLVPFLQKLSMVQDAAGHTVDFSRTIPNLWSSVHEVCLIGLFLR